MWVFGSLAPAPCNSFNRTDLKDAILITSAGLLGVLGMAFVWLLLALMLDVSVSHAIFHIIHVEWYLLESFIESGFALSWFIFVVNLIPAYPFDGATILVALMRYNNAPEEQIYKIYLTVNLFISFNIIVLAAAQLSSLWTLVAMVPLLQALHVFQLRTLQCVNDHPLFRLSDRLIIPESNVVTATGNEYQNGD